MSGKLHRAVNVDSGSALLRMGSQPSRKCVRFAIAPTRPSLRIGVYGSGTRWASNHSTFPISRRRSGPPPLRADAETVLRYWRESLNDERANPGRFEQHLIPFDLIEAEPTSLEANPGRPARSRLGSTESRRALDSVGSAVCRTLGSSIRRRPVLRLAASSVREPPSTFGSTPGRSARCEGGTHHRRPVPSPSARAASREGPAFQREDARSTRGASRSPRQSRCVVSSSKPPNRTGLQKIE